MPQTAATTDYRFSPALLARSLGALTAILGALLVVVAVLVASAGLPVAFLTGGIVGSAVLVVLGGALVVFRARLVTFDDAGYRVRFLRGAGVKQARWREVEDAVAARVAGQDCVVLRLRDGRTTSIPVKVLDSDARAFMTDLRSRLDRARGYRRLA